MRRRRPRVVIPEMPAKLRVFDPAEWPGIDSGPFRAEYYAQSRWFDARAAWCEERGVDYVTMLRHQRAQRRAAWQAEAG